MKTKGFLQFSVIIILVLMALSPISANAQSPQVLYAVQGGLTSGTCDSWVTACELQYALTSAASGQEIWAAAGVYKPTTDPTDRAATFQLKSGVGLYGGFAGTETTRDQRNWDTNTTILSGDIDNNDINTDVNFVAETTADILGYNSYHVLTGSGTDGTAILDGFIITAGQADDVDVYPNYEGGGMYNESGSPTLTNITFSANSAVYYGGAIYNTNSSPTMTSTIFSSNASGKIGGAVFNENYSNPILRDVIFSFNSTSESAGSAGGMYNSQSNPTLVNVIFLGNSASYWGGGIYNTSSNPTLTNVTFTKNQAGFGGAMANYNSSPILTNAILWNDTGNEMYNPNSSPTITYSNVQGGWSGAGNIDADPLFVDAANGDLRLQSGSPAIDTGTNDSCPATDFDGVSRPQDGNNDGIYTCDMGAYELVEIPGTPPANDNFADAEVISTLPSSVTADTTWAGVEPSEPQYCYDSQKTVWYSFKPTATGAVRVDMAGNSFSNTVIKIYQAMGPGIGDLNLITCAAHSGNSATFKVQAGETYYIQAGGIDAAGGALELNLQEALPPTNDDFGNASAINSLPFSNAVNNTDATTEPNEPNDDCAVTFKTIWYSFTPATNMTVKADTVGSSFLNTQFKVYQDTGAGIGGLSFLGCAASGNPATLNLQAEVTYYFQVGSMSFASGDLLLNLQEVFPPANDSFGNAKIIDSPLPFDDTVDITNASLETSEPNPSCAWYGSLWKTVWYAYTPSASGVVSASVPSAAFAPVLAVYTGDSLTGLTELGCQVFWGNKVTISVAAGTTYYFQVGKLTSWDADGVVQFHLEAKNPPANDNLANAKNIDSLPFDDIVNNTDATLEPDESQPCPWAYNSYNTVWYKFTPTAKAAIRADMAGSSFSNTAITLFLDSGSGITPWACRFYGNSMPIIVEPGITYYLRAGNTDPGGGELHFNLYEVPIPPNDNFGNATVISSLPFTDSLDNLAATAEPNEPQNCDYSERTVWYSYTPTIDGLLIADMYGSNVSDTVLSIYQDTGNGISGLTYLSCTSYSGSISVKVRAGTTYYIQAKNVYGGGTIQVNVQQLPVPPNDDFENAKTVKALPFIDSVDISNATRESNEPNYCYSAPKTVWYSFTPTANAVVKVDTQGSGFWDAVLNVYQATGPNITDLNPIQCAGFGNSSILTVEAGTTYYIQAGSYYGSNGNLQLNLVELPRPANDDFENAALVSLPLPFDHTVDTQYASRQTGEPTPSCAGYDPGTRSVWYAFTPTTNGSVSASVPWAAFTPVLAAYTGSSLNNLTQVGCQTYSNLMTFHVNAGNTYYFQVGNYYSWEQGGSMQFHLDITPPPTAGFYYYPSDPSVFDTIQFYDSSYDPGQVGFQSFSWDFGDGTISNSFYPTHKYVKDGDYTVQHSVTTAEGRTASITQVVQVRTHDVAITKINAPQSASAKQTRTITVSVNSKNYAETVQVDLYKSIPGGYEFVGSITVAVPAYSTNRTTAFNFIYTFTSSDASIGKVTFKAVATIVNVRDSYPSDNEAISSPPTKVSRGR